MELKLTAVGNDAPGETHTPLAAAVVEVRVHRLGVGEGRDLDAVPVLVADAGHPLLERGEARATLDVQCGEAGLRVAV
jgi:hypothetical protein